MGTLTVISVYAPTDQADGQDKDLFYLQLSSVVEGCKAGEIPLLLGDFNARVGPERAGYEDVVGPHSSTCKTYRVRVQTPGILTTAKPVPRLTTSL